MGILSAKPDKRVQPGIGSANDGKAKDAVAAHTPPNPRQFSYQVATADQSTAVIHGKYSPSKWDIWMLGVTIVIGGQYFSWNAGFEAGLYSYLIAYFIIAGAYITLCCCTSEVTGALPFAGGAYGLSRCTLGFFPGYLIGCCEALEYIATGTCDRAGVLHLGAVLPHPRRPRLLGVQQGDRIDFAPGRAAVRLRLTAARELLQVRGRPADAVRGRVRWVHEVAAARLVVLCGRRGAEPRERPGDASEGGDPVRADQLRADAVHDGADGVLRDGVAPAWDLVSADGARAVQQLLRVAVRCLAPVRDDPVAPSDVRDGVWVHVVLREADRCDGAVAAAASVSGEHDERLRDAVRGYLLRQRDQLPDLSGRAFPAVDRVVSVQHLHHVRVHVVHWPVHRIHFAEVQLQEHQEFFVPEPVRDRWRAVLDECVGVGDRRGHGVPGQWQRGDPGVRLHDRAAVGLLLLVREEATDVLASGEPNPAGGARDEIKRQAPKAIIGSESPSASDQHFEWTNIMSL